MGLQIISADMRMKEKRGVKALVLGPPGIGKTSLLRTLDPERTLFLDFEAGDLSVNDVRVDQIRPKTWRECQDLACFLAGPDLDLEGDLTYSQKHYDRVCKEYGDTDLSKYSTFFVDSLTVAGRVCLKWAGQQPDAFNKQGEKNNLGKFGLYGREMLDFLSRLQHVRQKNVIFVAILEQQKDEFGRSTWEAQIDGGKVGRELPGIVDEVLTMQLVPHPNPKQEGQMVRAFVTSADNEWGYPAKDRSGRLAPIEKPHLGDLIIKLTSDATGSSAKTTPVAPSVTTEMETA